VSKSKERGERPGREKVGIQVLSDSVIDQIAAGEVVERPASVVKELVENALDADARRIRVEIREGGIALVAVTDDGVGMSPGDAHLCLQRHATSKLSAPDDLLRIASFGFRGEALPSIASVSRMRLRTRLRGADDRGTGYEIRLDGGSIVSEGEVSMPAGTRVEVADLFANVPARRKFLKRPQTEWGHIADWLGRLALALPGVHLEVQRDDKPPLVWPATADPLDRIAAVLSERDAAALVAVEHEEPTGHIQAFVSAPEHTRPNTNSLYLFVNGRPVRDRLLRQALLDVYRDWLPRGRFPVAVVFLTVPREEVDVNVHPAKWEVRFADPRAIHRLVRRSVREAISGRSWLAGAAPAADSSAAPPAAAVRDRPRAVMPGHGAADKAATTDWIFARAQSAEAAGEGGPSASPARALQFGELRSLGQLRASYLLVEGENGLLLVDQHAAHERVLYERLRAQWLEQGVSSQGLLLPQTVSLDAAAVAALREHAEAVARLGFEIDAFGEDAVLVRGVPAPLADRDPCALTGELARELAADGVRGELDSDATRWLPAVDRIFASLACHSARRAGDHLEAEEQRGLLRELDTIPWAPTCPHGRPVAVAIDLAEIERRFARR
jgi:DNA mismatch repair protein MutL